jgi:phosphoenolpyruvate carboxylase
MGGEDEVREAYINFAMGIQEVMWDAEGKDVDSHVVRKLLSSYSGFFREHVLGRDVFLTYRIPNPRLESADRKVFAEILESIPLASDVARAFYGADATPVFEVILPFTKSSSELLDVVSYYERVVAAKGDVKLAGGSTVRDLVGDFRPERLEVIPLLEDMESMFSASTIMDEYYRALRPAYVRVFLARSDPAVQHGMFAAMLAVKVALSEVHGLLSRHDLPVFPILGVGSLPFRGGLSPRRRDLVMREYGGVSTFTVQSAFRYDYPDWEVEEAVAAMNTARVPPPKLLGVDEEERARALARRCEAVYVGRLQAVAGAVNAIAGMLPRRRTRKLHVGTFGYSRNVAGIALPRAIAFTGALYSIGIPPEILGAACLRDLGEGDWRLLEELYLNAKNDLEEAAQFYDEENLEEAARIFGIPADALRAIKDDAAAVEWFLGRSVGPRELRARRHSALAKLFLISTLEDSAEAGHYLEEAARARMAIG